MQRGAGKTIVAGYPWFTDWGRDTFIALRGFWLCRTGSALRARHPARLGRRGVRGHAAEPLPGLAASARVQRGRRLALVRDRGRTSYLEAAARRDRRGRGRSARSRAAIEPDPRRLSRRHALRHPHGRRTACSPPACPACSSPGWTPRSATGWSRRASASRSRCRRCGSTRCASRPTAPECWRGSTAARCASFQLRFWNERRGCLYDVVDVDHEPGRNDRGAAPQPDPRGRRPALSGPGRAVRAAASSRRSSAQLLTPLGLRSLAPGEPGYSAALRRRRRASATARYHQGTVWPWLMGPFVEAWLRVRGDTPRREARGATRASSSPLRAHLDAAGLGHISEIADAEPPHRPGGCPFQAWSLAELLRSSLLAENQIVADHARATSRSARAAV